MCGTTRIPESKTGSTLWFSLLAWVRATTSTRLEGVSVTRKQDKMVRICSINNVLLSSAVAPWNAKNDPVLKRFLQGRCQNSQYMNVSFRELRLNTKSTDRSMFWRYFLLEFYAAPFMDTFGQYTYYRNQCRINPSAYNEEHKAQYAVLTVLGGVFTWLFGPIYILSRIFTTLFPVWIVLYLYANDVFVWSAFFGSSDAVQIDLLQVIMLTVYLLLLAVLLLISILNLREQYLLFHFLGSCSNLGSVSRVEDAKRWIKAISNHYYGVITVPIRRALVLDVFGADIGPIIISYLPAEDHYDGIEEVLLAKTL